MHAPAWLCATRAPQPGRNPNGRRCCEAGLNWAKLLLLQGDFASHHYLSRHDKPLRHPKPVVSSCCDGGCVASWANLPSQPTSQANQPQHKCWDAGAFAAPDNSVEEDGDNTIIGYSQADIQAELQASELQAMSD